MPLRWIEESEARRVVAAARYDLPSPPFGPPGNDGRWADRVRRWVTSGRTAADAQAAILTASKRDGARADDAPHMGNAESAQAHVRVEAAIK